MGTTLNATGTVQRLPQKLTRREIDVCVLHFIDGRSEDTIAQWLHISLKTVKRIIASAMAKVPQLKRLRVNHRQLARKPRIVHLSQIENSRDRERGPFNADEV